MTNNEYSLGLVSISFRKNTPKEILEAMKQAGLTHIEWGSDVHAPCNDAERLDEIVALQEEYGITCSSYGTYFRLGETPIEELENYISAAKRLGTDILRLWCGVKSGEDMTPEEKDFLVGQCREAAQIAAKHGVTLCMECHKKTFTQNIDDAVWLMKEIDSPNFRMYWQPFQWDTAEKNIENARAIAPFAEHLHVFNWCNEKKFPLEGAVETWRAYLAQFSKPRTLLLEFMPKGSVAELNTEANSLKKIAAQ